MPIRAIYNSMSNVRKNNVNISRDIPSLITSKYVVNQRNEDNVSRSIIQSNGRRYVSMY